MDNECYLEMVEPDNNHFKFWKAELQGNQIVREWGRIGETRQRKVDLFNNAVEARNFFVSKQNEKLNKGYKRTQESIHKKDIMLSKLIRKLNQ